MDPLDQLDPLDLRNVRIGTVSKRSAVETAVEAAVEASVRHAFGNRTPSLAERERYVAALHKDDLALAVACSMGDEAAWERFVAEYAPLLRRAARAIDPTGRADELADSLIGELFGVGPGGARPSLFRYFHGRSKLGTWLRAVLAQRHVDMLRASKRLEPLADNAADEVGSAGPDHELAPERTRFQSMMHDACGSAIQALPARDRLRLSCYYLQRKPLAAIGKMLGEHEATVSRHLTRIRVEIREAVDARLRKDHGLDDEAIAECFRTIVDDAGPLNLAEWLGTREARKKTAADRSTG